MQISGIFYNKENVVVFYFDISKNQFLEYLEFNRSLLLIKKAIDYFQMNIDKYKIGYSVNKERKFENNIDSYVVNSQEVDNQFKKLVIFRVD